MEKVYLLKYPWVNGVVLAEVGSRVLVKFTRGDCTILSRSDLGKGYLVEGFDEETISVEGRFAERVRKGLTEAVADDVGGRDDTIGWGKR